MISLRFGMITPLQISSRAPWKILLLSIAKLLYTCSISIFYHLTVNPSLRTRQDDAESDILSPTHKEYVSAPNPTGRPIPSSNTLTWRTLQQLLSTRRTVVAGVADLGLEKALRIAGTLSHPGHLALLCRGAVLRRKRVVRIRACAMISSANTAVEHARLLVLRLKRVPTYNAIRVDKYRWQPTEPEDLPCDSSP